MDSAAAIDIARETIVTGTVLLLPILGVALVVGCLMSLLQTITQVQDQALSFVPKLLAVGAIVLLLMPWMADYYVEYAREMILSIPQKIAGG